MRFYHKHSLALVVMLLFVCAGAGARTRSSKPAASILPRAPETTASLELLLSIAPDAGTTSTFVLTATLRNTTSEPVTLLGDSWTAMPAGTDFPTYLRKQLMLETDPVTYGNPAQTMAFSNPQETSYTIAAHGEIISRWKTFCGCLKTTSSEIYNSAPCLRERGRYLVTARLFTKLASGEELRLKSDPAPLDFGGSSQPPHQTWARVTNVRLVENLATLDVGSEDGVELGKTWSCRGEHFHIWQMTVSEVHLDHSVVKINHMYVGGEAARPQTLNEGAIAWRADTTAIPDCAREN